MVKSRRSPLPMQERHFHQLVAHSINVFGSWKENFVHAPLEIDPTSQPIVSAPHQGQPVFDRAKNRIGSVLPLRGAFANQPLFVRLRIKSVSSSIEPRVKWGKTSSKQIRMAALRLRSGKQKETGCWPRLKLPTPVRFPMKSNCRPNGMYSPNMTRLRLR